MGPGYPACMAQILFEVSGEAYTKILFAGRALGYQRPGDFVRAKILEIVGECMPPNYRPRPPLTVNQAVVLDAIRERPKTVRQICSETGKLIPVIGPVVHSLVDLGWIIENQRDVWTGGRPASNYSPTELGFKKLEETHDLKRQQVERAEKLAELQRAESAKRHPDPKPDPTTSPRLKATETETDLGRYTQACLDSLYKAHPEATPEQVEPAIENHVAMAKDQVNHCGSDWAREMASIPTEWGLT